MGFYGYEPFDTAQATYVWTGVRTPGFFLVQVSGQAPNYTTGIQLVRDPHFVGGLKVNVMGWTGPIGEGTTPYSVHATFPGDALRSIVVSGENKQEVIEVQEVPAEQAEDHMQSLAQSG